MDFAVLDDKSGIRTSVSSFSKEVMILFGRYLFRWTFFLLKIYIMLCYLFYGCLLPYKYTMVFV